MDTSIAKEMIRFIRAERDRRIEHLPEDPDAADAQWQFKDEPFINELCLTLIVAIRHHVEIELVKIAAQVTSDGRELDIEEYQQRVEIERERLRGERKGQENNERNDSGWKRIIRKLRLTSFPEWNSSMKTLQLLANSYKHHPWGTPEEKLLKHLNLEIGPSYNFFSESQDLRKGLADSLSVAPDYCDITDAFLTRADRFLAEVQAQSQLSPIKRRTIRAPLNPKKFLR